MAHASTNATWVDYPSTSTLITAATLENLEAAADRLTINTFGAVARTAYPVVEFHLTAQQGSFSGDVVLQSANWSVDVDNASGFHLGSLTANDFITYTIPIAGRYSLYFRGVFDNITGANEVHILKNSTTVSTGTIAQSWGGSLIEQEAYQDCVLAANDVIRWAMWSSVTNFLDVSRLGQVTTKMVVRYVGSV